MTKSFDRVAQAGVIETIAAIDAGANSEAVFDRFADFVAAFGFTTVALGHLANPAMKADQGKDWFRVGNWPEEWRREWLNKRLIFRDPIARMALRTRKSFTWSAAYQQASRFERAVLDHSSEFGFRDGLAIPMYTEDGPPGCVTLGAEKVDLSPREKAAIELVAIHAYARLEILFGPFSYRPVKDLSPRELDVLHYAAAGKTNWEIGTILSISEFSVRGHLSSAQKKLNCVNRAHSIATAMQRSLIFP